MSHPPLPDFTAAHLRVSRATPAWFEWALAQPVSSHYVTVADCPIHYMLWPGDNARANQRGLLLVHGGGAHANWWRFIAPFFTRDYRVAALDLSGMGDSGKRAEYNASLRADEMRAVLGAAELGDKPFVVGHSFGGYMTMRFGAAYGHEVGGAVIVDTPIRRPEGDAPPAVASRARSLERHYPSFGLGLERFRLLPPQPCENEYLVEFIARHSLREEAAGWTWKFDVNTMSARRWGEPFHEHLQALKCRAALIFGQHSALVSRDTADYMSELMGPQAPIIEIPEAQHHLLLDQPLAFVAALRTLLASWVRDEIVAAGAP
ncbi:MAG: alpha/beta hydrolase [Gammaproteobacteria bacterium]|nr:alpha/beta hydrolase [Gammaproteobacteria bacterium]